MNEYVPSKNNASLETFLATQYFVNGYLEKKNFPYFDSDLGGIVNQGTPYTIDKENKKLLVNGRSYKLPDGWAKREEAYYNALKVFK